MLKKEIGFVGVFAIAAGAMISSGIFVLPGVVFPMAGPAIILSYMLAGLLMVPAMLAQAELATAMPKSGGTYFFVDRSLGDFAGTLAGSLSWISITLKAAFALVGIGAIGAFLIPGLGDTGVKWIAAVSCLFFGILNACSVKSTGRLQVALVFAMLGIFALYLLRGLPAVESSRYVPFMPENPHQILTVAAMVFVSFGGLTKVVDVAGEVRRPGRNIPGGMLLAFGVVEASYILVLFVTIGTVDAQSLSGSLVPLSLGARATMGSAGVVLLSAAAFFAFATTANAGMLSASRSPMAMSRDGLLPAFLSRTNKKRGTPVVAIAVTTAFMLLVILFLPVVHLVKTASAMMLMMFVMVNVAVVTMRFSRLPSYRPLFKAPWCPWMQIAAVPVYLFLIFEMSLAMIEVTAGFLVVVCAWYLLYVRRRIERESAFIYLAKRIVSGKLERTGLETELRRISLERDGVELDRFDHLVHECAILDIQAPISAKDLFHRVAEVLSSRLNIAPEHLYELFLARERESTTVIAPKLAIPHVVVDGENLFDLVLVRCREGIVFSELNPPVKTAFILIGSPDERNYHLRALMTIAHIVQEPDFEARWLQARNSEQLRDIILLSTREREKK